MKSSSGIQRVSGVIFDMDATLVTCALDFGAIREALGLSAQDDILLTVASWGEAERARAEAVIEAFEARAAEQMRALPGVEILLDHLEERGVLRAVVTRNTMQTVRRMTGLLGERFDPLIDRGFWPPKPAPDALLHIVRGWGMEPDEVWMVGDSRHDLEAARAAGMRCALVRYEYNAGYRGQADRVVEHPGELCDLWG